MTIIITTIGTTLALTSTTNVITIVVVTIITDHHTAIILTIKSIINVGTIITISTSAATDALTCPRRFSLGHSISSQASRTAQDRDIGQAC